MIGKGKFFDFVSRIADMFNNVNNSVAFIINSFYEKYGEFKTKMNQLLNGNTLKANLLTTGTDKIRE